MPAVARPIDAPVWTPARVALLRRIYPDCDMQAALRAINAIDPHVPAVASCGAIYVKAWEIGVKRTRETRARYQLAWVKPAIVVIERSEWPAGVLFPSDEDPGDGTVRLRYPAGL
jgi:hypothetical protein